MSTSDYRVPDISDWLSTPAAFNSVKHGGRALLSEGNSVVERRMAEIYYGNCVVYTRDPLGVGRMWQITVLETTLRWIGGLVSGCVLCFL